jgi:hypothetical protein
MVPDGTLQSELTSWAMAAVTSSEASQKSGPTKDVGRSNDRKHYWRGNDALRRLASLSLIVLVGVAMVVATAAVVVEFVVLE